MWPDQDLSNRCLVLSTGTQLWRDVLHPGVRLGSAADGRDLAKVRVDPEDIDGLCSEETLDLIEYGALMIVDLVQIDPKVFPLVEWLARVRPSSVLLFRHGKTPLPFELHEFLVRSFEIDDPSTFPDLRVTVATLATLGAAAQDRGPEHGRSGEKRRLRRERNGVRARMQAAMQSVLDGDRTTARALLAEAVEIEPKAHDLLLRAAVLERLAGHWVGARDLLLRAVRRDPDSAPSWRELGIVRQQTGADGVDEALKRAIELDADFEAMVTLALRMVRRGEADDSTSLLERAMRVSGGQLNLVIPTLEARAARDLRVSMANWERARLETVLEIRRIQARIRPAARRALESLRRRARTGVAGRHPGGERHGGRCQGPSLGTMANADVRPQSGPVRTSRRRGGRHARAAWHRCQRRRWCVGRSRPGSALRCPGT